MARPLQAFDREKKDSLPIKTITIWSGFPLGEAAAISLTA